MTRRISAIGAALIVLFLVRCAAVSQVPAEPTGELKLIDLSPAAGSVLTAETTLEATLEYVLSGLRRPYTYEVVPQFDEVRGEGRTFNKPRPGGSARITRQRGRTTISYAISREWSDARLARPIQVWFYLIENGEHTSRVVAKAGPFSYKAAASDSVQ